MYFLLAYYVLYLKKYEQWLDGNKYRPALVEFSQIPLFFTQIFLNSMLFNIFLLAYIFFFFPFYLSASKKNKLFQMFLNSLGYKQTRD
jgi:hypothetical protein